MDRSYLIEYAGFAKRFFAYLVDLASIYVFQFIISFLIGVFYARSGGTLTDPITVQILTSITSIISTIVYVLYASFMESSVRQTTLGKILLKIVVTDLQGNRVGFGHALARNTAKMFSTLTFYIGYLMCGFTKRKQALHDILAQCLVIVKD